MLNLSVFAVSVDSIGRKVENGKLVIIHKVDMKETVYSISKKYGITLETLYDANPTAKESLKVGQVLKIPTNIDAKETVTTSTHTVAQGETVYSISKIYGCSVEEIKEWNNLNTTDLSTGQTLTIKKSTGLVLDTRKIGTTDPSSPRGSDAQEQTDIKYHIVKKEETLYSISKLYNQTIETLQKWNGMPTSAIEIGQQLVVAGGKEIPIQTKPVVVAQNTPTNSNTIITTQVIPSEKTETSKPTTTASTTATNPTTTSTPVSTPLPTKPITTSTTANTTAPKTTTPTITYNQPQGNMPKFHTVVKGETLFSISKKYAISVEDLKSWNNLSDTDQLEPDQLLVVSAIKKQTNQTSALETLKTVNKTDQTAQKTTNTTTNNPKLINNTSPVSTTTPKTTPVNTVKKTNAPADPNEVNAALAQTEELLKSLGEFTTGEQKPIENPVQTEVPVANTNKPTEDKDHWYVPKNVRTYEDSIRYGFRTHKENVGEHKKTVESGVCELILENHWDSKYNALHADAEIGTIIQVKNVETGVSVFVKVVGRLVETHDEPNLILRISHHAEERLAIGRSRFPVEISYIP